MSSHQDDPHHDPHHDQVTEHEADVVSDPNLDDPLDDAPEAQAEEGTQSDWSSEGGATVEGPATETGAADA